MNAQYKPIPELTAQDRALKYYTGKVNACVAELAKSLGRGAYKYEDLWIRNFTCHRTHPFALLGKQTRFPDMLKIPKFRQAVAANACDAFRRHGWEVDSYIRPNRRLRVSGSARADPVGSGYELRVRIKVLPANIEDQYCEVHGTES